MRAPDTTSDTALLIEAAALAGEIALRYFRVDHRVWDKADGAGPVTEADLAVDAMLRSHLIGARPGYGWLSEETADDAARLDAERCFIIDPIDGTRAFISGEVTWAHSLAVAEAGRVVAAVVAMPAKKAVYAAARGAGATRNGKPLHVSAAAGPDDVTIVTARPNLAPHLWPGGLPRHARHYRPSLAYRLALVGEGRYDAMVTFRDTWEWDIAAGALIVEEAGGTVTDRLGAPLRFNTPGRLAAGTLAANPALHHGLIQRILS
ncbi:inositol monophosphatase family protein [Vannielia litorea]|uniref:Myo-inositol-1(Or 4)-monophosphatase n=1 Tax=Vannielia litorea TaxID=1217970 RepID=A0A1N6HP60_9RHOB|nr:inositol monophosphatase family protein [Vannielia litorea]SIO21562.1 myo-inositol-1(or 4)-monophosphatase [Vannielia litorea]